MIDSWCSFSRMAAFQLKVVLSLKCTLSLLDTTKKKPVLPFNCQPVNDTYYIRCLILFYNVLDTLNTFKKHSKTTNWFIRFSSHL